MSPALFLLFACAPSEVEVHSIDEDTIPAETEALEDFSEWDGAMLEVLYPASGDFLPWGEVNSFSARVVDEDGDDMGFDEIQWTSDIDDVWEPVGGRFDDDALDIGTHTLTASAELPNGDRLAYSLGGVLVQSIYAGTYAGSLTVSTEYDGYAFACSGGSTLVVDPYGVDVTGDANCLLLLSFSGYELELDLEYVSNIENDMGVLGGDMAAEVYGYELPVDFEGALTEDGQLTGDFTTELLGVLLDGSLSADRVSRDTEGVEETN
jgi:hypothetical protein